MFRLCITGLFLIVSFLVSCRPQQEQSVEVIPTPAPLPTVVRPDAQAALRVATNFLESWRIGDYQAMYNLLSFPSQEATSFGQFISTYQASQDVLTMQEVEFQPLVLVPGQVSVLSYNAVFTTNVLGEFTDTERELHLIIDERAGDWRVAWSPADIFTGMDGGTRLRLIPNIPNRANIYDRNGVILADQLGRVVTVSVVRQNAPQYDTCLSLLSQVLNQDVTVVESKLNEGAPDWLTRVGIIEAEAYTAMHTQLEDACDAQFDDLSTRRYTNPTLAPHILGYVGYPDEASLPAIEAAGFTAESILGRSGIELSWDEILRGHPGGRLVIVSPSGERLRTVAESPPRPSESLWLTLDSELQQTVYLIIADAYDAARDGWARESKGAAAVIMNINTGEILAMVSYPTFDINAFTPFPVMGRDAANAMVASFEQDRRRPQFNRTTLGSYPAASVMKTVSTIAVADSGVYDLDERYTCVGLWSRERNFTRGDWKPEGHGALTLRQALTQSCDPYFYEVGYQLDQVDPFLLPIYARRLGLGGPTGLLELPESYGTIPDRDWLMTTRGAQWTFSDAVNMAIGQGYVEVTPLQITRLFAAVANGGTLYRPQLVHHAGILGEEPRFVFQPDAMAAIDIDPEILAMVREGLCGVTTERPGTAEYQFRDSELQTLGVCGKTGTAENPRPGQEDPLPHAWFAAYAPAANPEIAIAVIVENSGEGSAVAAPIVRDILQYYFFEMPFRPTDR